MAATVARRSEVLAPEIQSLLDESPDAVLIVDRAGKIVALNRRTETLFATTAEQLQGQPVEILVPKQTRGAHASVRAAYGSAPTLRAMSARSGLMGLRADGTEFPVEVSLTPVIGSTASLVIAVVREVASRVSAEAAIASVDRSVEALDAISDAILTTDIHGNIDFLNRSAEALTGLTRDSARRRPLSEVLPLLSEASGKPLASPATACLRRGIPAACDAVLRARPGQDSRALDLSTTLIRDAAGALTGAMVLARDVTHARLIARELSHRATHDALTGLVNRGEFERRLARVLASSAKERGEHAVCFLDLDGFKKVNDACGHLAGDEMLRQLSELMRNSMRFRDTLARLGGDEFGMLLEHCKLSRAERIAEKLRKAIFDYRFTFGAETYAVTVSIGIVPIRADTRRPSDVFEAADAACYLAKHEGGNRIQASVPGPRAARSARKGHWRRRVDIVAEEHRFRLYAQPIVALDPSVPGPPRFELLLRLDAGPGEPCAPQPFLSAARRQGLMPTVDRWVVREAIRRLSDWRRSHHGLEPMTVAINLDDETVIAGQVLELVRGELANTDVRPQALCFEISESVATAHPAASARLLRELRSSGCQTTLEECGTGMAPFTLLRQLRPDHLKIAGHIVRRIVRDPVCRVLATALNEVGHILGIETIGVQAESPAVLASLRRIGVDYAQGFAVGLPEPLEVPLP